MARYSKRLNDVASFTLLNATTLNPDYKIARDDPIRCLSGKDRKICDSYIFKGRVTFRTRLKNCFIPVYRKFHPAG